MNFINSTILEILSVWDTTTTNRLCDIENLKFMELFNVSKFKKYKNNFSNFLFCLYNIPWKKK